MSFGSIGDQFYGKLNESKQEIKQSLIQIDESL